MYEDEFSMGVVAVSTLGCALVAWVARVELGLSFVVVRSWCGSLRGMTPELFVGEEASERSSEVVAHEYDLLEVGRNTTAFLIVSLKPSIL